MRVRVVAEANEPGQARGEAHFAGRLNNLVTSDLENIIEGRDFLFIGAPRVHVPRRRV